MQFRRQGEVECRAWAQPWARTIAFQMRGWDEESKPMIAHELVYSPVAPGAETPETFRLTPNAAQSLMDDLWAAGLRPTEGSGSAGALAATQLHLKDMQSIANRAMDVVLKHAAEPPIYSINTNGSGGFGNV